MNQDALQAYSKFVYIIFDNTRSIKEIQSMLIDKYYNKKEVIDLIAEGDMQIILNHPKVDRIVSDFWEGPYEKHSFLSGSWTFKILKDTVSPDSKFLGYEKQEDYRYGLEKLINPRQQLIHNPRRLEKQKAHAFHFKQWQYSLKVKFVGEALVILIVWLVYFQFNLVIVDYVRIYFNKDQDYEELEAQINNGTFTGTELTQKQAELVAIDDDMIHAAQVTVKYINNTIYLCWVTVTYFMK